MSHRDRLQGHRIALPSVLWVVGLLVCFSTDLGMHPDRLWWFRCWLLASVTICAALSATRSAFRLTAMTLGFVMSTACFWVGIAYLTHVGGLFAGMYLALLVGSQGAIVATGALGLVRWIGRSRKWTTRERPAQRKGSAGVFH